MKCIHFLLLLLVALGRSEGRMLKVLTGSAGFGSAEGRNPLGFLGQSFGGTTQASILNPFNQQTQSQYGMNQFNQQAQSQYGVIPFNQPTQSTFGLNLGFGNDQNNQAQYFQQTTPGSIFGLLNQAPTNLLGQQQSQNNVFQPTQGFPFNLIPTTPQPQFPMNLIPQLPSIPNPLGFLFPTTQRPFPFNLFGWKLK